VVRAGGVRGKGRQAGLPHVEFRPGNGLRGENHRLGSAAPIAAEGEAAPGSPPMADEWIVEAKAGGTCIVRVVHSLFASTDDWDGQLEGIEQGWPGIFQDSAPVPHALSRHGMRAGDGDGGRAKLGGRGVEGRHRTAETRGRQGRADVEAPPGVPPLGGTIEGVSKIDQMPNILVRLDAPTPGVASLGVFPSGGITVLLSLYLYGDRAAAAVARDQPLWQKWMSERFS